MRHTQRALAALAALAALSVAVVGGCGGGVGSGGSPPPSPTPLTSGAADITGVVRTLTAGAGDGSAAMLVVADQSLPSAFDRAMVSLTAETLVWAPAGEGRRTLSIADLAAGQRVAVRFVGPVAESYPVQATAGDVEILSPLSPD